MPTYTGLDVHLCCGNPEKSAAFYAALGFRLERHDAVAETYAFRLGDARLVLEPARASSDEERARLARPWSHGVVLAVATTDVGAAHAAAVAAGARVVEAAGALVVEDPDGHRLRFEQVERPPAPPGPPLARRRTGKSAARRVKPAKVARKRSRDRGA